MTHGPTGDPCRRPLRRTALPGRTAATAVMVACTLLAGVGGAQQPAGPTSVVSGVVYDSIVRHTIAGATVEFVNADDPSARPLTTTSDASGRYSLGALPHGNWFAGFFHPALDTLGLESPPRRVVITGPAQRVDLATPSARTVMAAVCPAGVRDSTALLIGHVRATEDQTPKAGASVRVEWGELVVDDQGINERRRNITTRTAEPGWFAVCGLPTDPVLQARAFEGADSSGFVEIQLEPNGLRHVSILVGGATAVPVASADGAAAGEAREMALRGRARLTGTVMDRGGRPVVGAHAVVWDTRLDAVTNERGVFSLDGLPGGTHTLEIRAIGYIPATSTVHLAESRPATAEVVVAKAAEILPTVTIRAELVFSRNLAEFDRRRRAGFGKYVTMSDIASRPNAKLSQLLQGMQGVEVRHLDGNNTVTMQRNSTTVGGDGSFRSSCIPSLFVDGTLDQAGDFDRYFSNEIVGIEIYREASRPFEFIDARNPCGAIAIWTRPLPPKKP